MRFMDFSLWIVTFSKMLYNLFTNLGFHAFIAITKAAVLSNRELVHKDRKPLQIEVLILIRVQLLVLVLLLRRVSTSLKYLSQLARQFERTLRRKLIRRKLVTKMSPRAVKGTCRGTESRKVATAPSRNVAFPPLFPKPSSLSPSSPVHLHRILTCQQKILKSNGSIMDR